MLGVGGSLEKGSWLSEIIFLFLSGSDFFFLISLLTAKFRVSGGEVDSEKPVKWNTMILKFRFVSFKYAEKNV